MNKNKNYILIPEGVNNKYRHPQKKLMPNFVYRQMIEYTAKIANKNDRIYLAPGNFFGSDYSEQELANNYLNDIGANASIIVIKSPNNTYIDTLGNALVMMKNIKNKEIVFELVCENIHSYRAEHCFRKIGFNISKVHRIPYIMSSEKIHPRVYHQKNLQLHIIYEKLAIIRDIIRIQLNFYKKH